MSVDTASLINSIQRDSNQSTPKVGMGATRLMWTDRHAYTVIEVSKNGKRCTVQQDSALRVDRRGMTDWQDWSYTPNPEGRIETVSLRKDGKWRKVGDTDLYAIGWRDEHHDYSF